MKKTFLISLFFLFVFGGCEPSSLNDPIPSGTANIIYNLEKDAHVKLTIENGYNTLIRTLVDSYQNAGNYSIQFKQDNMTEGVYFYTLEATGNNYHTKTTNRLIHIRP